MRESKEETEKEEKKSGNTIEKNRIDCFDSAFQKLTDSTIGEKTELHRTYVIITRYRVVQAFRYERFHG